MIRGVSRSSWSTCDSKRDISALRPAGAIVRGGAFDSMYFLTVFFEMPNSRATRFAGSLSRTQRIRMVSQISNEINPLGAPLSRCVCKINLFERGPCYSVMGVNSFPPLRGQFLAAVSRGSS